MNKILKKLLSTNEECSSFFLRLALGLMILPHGLQKTFGLFGGHGFTGTMSFFTETMHIPYLFALLAIIAEFAGGIGLILGLFTRVSALGVGVTMAVAAFHNSGNGWFMNWFGQQKGEGLEFFVLAVGIAIALFIQGAGKLSIDRFLSK